MCVGLESIALVVAATAVIGVIVYLVLRSSFEFHELILAALFGILLVGALGVIYNNIKCEDYVLVLYHDPQCAAYVGELDYVE